MHSFTLTYILVLELTNRQAFPFPNPTLSTASVYLRILETFYAAEKSIKLPLNLSQELSQHFSDVAVPFFHTQG